MLDEELNHSFTLFLCKIRKMDGCKYPPNTLHGLGASKCALGSKGNDLSYEERLKVLKWTTLEQRRVLLSLTECYKTIHGLNGLEPYLFFTFASDYRLLRANHRYKRKVNSVKLFIFCSYYKFME